MKRKVKQHTRRNKRRASQALLSPEELALNEQTVMAYCRSVTRFSFIPSVISCILFVLVYLNGKSYDGMPHWLYYSCSILFFLLTIIKTVLSSRIVHVLLKHAPGEKSTNEIRQNIITIIVLTFALLVLAFAPVLYIFGAFELVSEKLYIIGGFMIYAAISGVLGNYAFDGFMGKKNRRKKLTLRNQQIHTERIRNLNLDIVTLTTIPIVYITSNAYRMERDVGMRLLVICFITSLLLSATDMLLGLFIGRRFKEPIRDLSTQRKFHRFSVLQLALSFLIVQTAFIPILYLWGAIPFLMSLIPSKEKLSENVTLGLSFGVNAIISGIVGNAAYALIKLYHSKRVSAPPASIP